MHVWSLPFRLAWVPGAGSGSCRPRPGARVELSPYRHPFVCGDGSQKRKFYKIIYEFGKKIHGISMHISCMTRMWWAAGQGRTTRARGHGVGRGGSTLPPRRSLESQESRQAARCAPATRPPVRFP